MSTSISDLYGLNNPQTINAVYDNSGSNSNMDVEDFFQLMIAEMTNMDFTSSESTDSTVYVTQLAQIASMQQMQELAYYSKSNYVMSMVGKEVTVANLSLGGNLNTDTGIVEKISLSGDEVQLYVNGKAYSLSNVMSVNNPEATTEEELSKAANMTPYLLKRGSDYASISWNAPECSDLSKYTFDVYYSEDSDFDTVSQVKNGILAGSFKGDAKDLHVELDDLEPDTKYYVNIIMSSSDGKQEVYQKLIFSTREDNGRVNGSSSSSGSSSSEDNDKVEEAPDISEGTGSENGSDESSGSVSDTDSAAGGDSSSDSAEESGSAEE